MFRKNLPKHLFSPRQQVLDVELSQKYDKDGVLRPSQKVVDASDPLLPSTQDYTLEKLLAAGVNLSVVDCTNLVPTVPSDEQVEALVSQVTADFSPSNND